MSWTIEKQRECNRKSYQKHKERRLATTKKYHRQLKLEVLGHYSNGQPHCACCGETIIEFLGIDHSGGGGIDHRAKVGSTYRLYLWLRRNSYPNGYRTLCHNCNLATSWGRICPHELLEVV